MRFNSSISQNGSTLMRSSVPQNLLSKVKSLVQTGQWREALELYTREGSSSSLAGSHLLFPFLIKACTSISSILHGKTIHAKTIEMGLQFDRYIATSLVNMYVRTGSLRYAVKVFDKMSECENAVRDVSLWNAMIDGYFRFGQIDLGLAYLSQMQSSGTRPDTFTLTILLGSCGGSYSVSRVLGKQIHGFIIRNLCFHDPYLETALITMYTSCGQVTHALNAFHLLEDKNNIAVWNAMISGLSKNGLWERSLEVFLRAKRLDRRFTSGSFAAALTACSQGRDLSWGRQIHLDAIKVGFARDPFVCTSLLTMYARSGAVDDAKQVFNHANKKIEMWNAMISCCVNNGCEYDALDAFIRLKSSEILPDHVTISNTLSACCTNGLYDFGRTVHAELIKIPLQNNVAVQSALLTFYFKHGRTEHAEAVFRTIEGRDVIAWSSMISGFFQNKSFEKSIDIFYTMRADGVEPDSDVLSTLISACSGLGNAILGSAIHGFSVKIGYGVDVFMACSLLEMYSTCGLLENAEAVFTSMPYKNLVAWNTMISGYCKNNKPETSISLFRQIMLHGLYPDSVSITNVLVAVSSSAGLTKGKAVHGYLVRNSIPSDHQVENALMDMYIKCGSLSYACKIFNSLSSRNLVAWNTIIAGYGSHGLCIEAIKLFDEMKSSGVMPDEVTFLSLITSCSHSGLVDEGKALFHSMASCYRVLPKSEHYMNVVDLLGRAGRLEEAYQFIDSSPIDHDQSMWRCLLSACCAHGNLELGELAAGKLCGTEAARSGDFVQLLKLYGEAGLWEKAARLRASMKEMGVKKFPGCSWIEVQNETVAFLSGDSSSPYTKEIYAMLNRVTGDMRGYEEDCYSSQIEPS